MTGFQNNPNLCSVKEEVTSKEWLAKRDQGNVNERIRDQKQGQIQVGTKGIFKDRLHWHLAMTKHTA